MGKSILELLYLDPGTFDLASIQDDMTEPRYGSSPRTQEPHLNILNCRHSFD